MWVMKPDRQKATIKICVILLKEIVERSEIFCPVQHET